MNLIIVSFHGTLAKFKIIRLNTNPSFAVAAGAWGKSVIYVRQVGRHCATRWAAIGPTRTIPGVWSHAGDEVSAQVCAYGALSA